MKTLFKTYDIYNKRDEKCNFHTHTTRCKHAEGTEREYVESAIRAGFKTLGFADHAPYNFGDEYVSRMRMSEHEICDYVHSVLRLRCEYKDDIDILLGFEAEYLPEYTHVLMEKLSDYPIDYMILGEHYLDTEVNGQHVARPCDDNVFLKKYVDRVIEAMNTGYFSYIAHPDIINYTGDITTYRREMTRLCMASIENKIPLEINLGGLADEDAMYPRMDFIELSAELGCDMIIGVDAHVPSELEDEQLYKKAYKIATDRGVNLICI